VTSTDTTEKGYSLLSEKNTDSEKESEGKRNDH